MGFWLTSRQRHLSANVHCPMLLNPDIKVIQTIRPGRSTLACLVKQAHDEMHLHYSLTAWDNHGEPEDYCEEFTGNESNVNGVIQQ